MASIPEEILQHPTNKDSSGNWDVLRTALMPLASLKLTVGLFAASIFIVLAGTFAQVNSDIWEVIGIYFRVDMRNLLNTQFPYVHVGELFVWIDSSIFFPASFFPATPVLPDYLAWMKPLWPEGTPDLLKGTGIYFPKGWSIGILMALNLLAAHALRFKVQAKGSRLTLGSIVLLLGSILTYLMILSGSSTEGLQASPVISYGTLQLLMLATTFGCCGVTFYGAIVAENSAQRQLNLVALGLLICLGVFISYWQASDAASMRILYQLVKATFAALVLLAGCIMVFKKRAGIVLLHGGIGLIMFYDVLVGTQHIETQMTIVEGETVNFSRDIRDVELAVIDRLDGDQEQVTAVGSSLVSKPKSTIADKRLPFDIEVLEFYKNSDVRGLRSFGPNEEVPKNLATAGLGMNAVAVEIKNVAGTDMGGKIDTPTAYVRLKSKGEFASDLGVYMLSTIFDLSSGPFGESQTVTVDGHDYEIALRFVRYYNDYTVSLSDVQKNDYKGTSKVKDYSSYITVTKPDAGTTFDYRIWMNNPMRFAGKTFYQSNYLVVEGGKEATTLQVVENAGWMTPYVACMIVAVGMLFHFVEALFRFLVRRARSPAPVSQKEALERMMSSSFGGSESAGWVLAAACLFGVLSYMAVQGWGPKEKDDEFHVGTFGELPMWFKGRPMPIDSYARNALLRLSDYELYRDDEDEKHPAVDWLLKMMSDEVAARDVRVFKIENKDVIEALGLEDRKRSTYSFQELLNSEKVDTIKEMGMLTIIRNLEGLTEIDASQRRDFEIAVTDTPEAERNLFQRKLLEVTNKVDEYVLMEFAVGGGRIIDLMQARLLSDEEKDPELNVIAQLEKLREFKRLHSQAFNHQPIPLMVPTQLGAGERPKLELFQSDWESPTSAKVFDQLYDQTATMAKLLELKNQSVVKPPAIKRFEEMLDAYKSGNVAEFNSTLTDYQAFLTQNMQSDEEQSVLSKTAFEAVYNRFDAFYQAAIFYVFAFVLAALGWLFIPQVFQRASFWTLVTVFAIHTAALIGRIYISGRPPVTNLYSSAIFIGWAVVFGGLIVESMTRLGIGNVVAAMSGFLALRIADGLASDGDTFVVLEAVLDTQFWLATHVVCITLGYATTYMAGLLGLVYLVMGIQSPPVEKGFSKEITRMVYGVLCFATFFSFVGTVLGGLWADDSWGRFWGWDPKENGALIIVLWNALILHARWGAIVKDRGLAVLAVAGNIVVSWSWFGVNELGVGLHSYGFTEGRLAWLALFVLSQLVVVLIGCLPIPLWRNGSRVNDGSQQELA